MSHLFYMCKEGRNAEKRGTNIQKIYVNSHTKKTKLSSYLVVNEPKVDQ